jgi:hypothetical protein
VSSASEDSRPSPDAPPTSAIGLALASIPRPVALVLGVLLFGGALYIAASVVGGKGEFSYDPFTPEPLPFAPMRGFTYEQLVAHAARVLLGTPALVLIWLAVRGRGPAWAPSEQTLKRWAVAVSVASVATIATLILFVFRGRALVDDELVYRMQAEYLSEWQLGLRKVPSLHETFGVATRYGFTGKYLFGEPLVQAPFVRTGYPALSHVPIAALTLWLFHRAAKLLGSKELAHLAVILVAASPMFVMTSATGQSQATSLLCVVATVLGYALVNAESSAAGACLVGMGVGFGVAVRIQVAMPVGAVFVPLTAWPLLERRRLWPLLVLLVSLAVWGVALGAYNRALTGSELVLPWYLATNPEHYGFGRVWETDRYEHTLFTALQNLGVVAVRLNAWWLGWPSSFLLGFLWYRWGRRTQGARAWLLVGAAVVLFELAYYSTGISETGSIYHYELLLPLAVLGANAIREGFARDGRAMRALLAVQFGLGATAFFAFEGNRITRLLHFIHDDAAAVLSRLPARSLLFYEPICSEATPHGWIHEFLPVRFRSDEDPVVTFPRPSPSYLDDYLRAYPGRACFYYRIDPATRTPQLTTCEEAKPLLERETFIQGNSCLWIMPTASQRGWYDPWTAATTRTLRFRRRAAPTPF